jgi:hypothetical protein
MPLYNLILYLWAAAGAVAVWRETPPRWRWLSAVGFLSVVRFRATAKAHFAWIEREAQRNPRWWNRAWVPLARS